MDVANLVTAGEYLATSFDPDCDFVDGVIEERQVGLKDHSALQNAIQIWFWQARARLQVRAFPEWRIKVSSNRYRIPDVTVVQAPTPSEQVLTTPPLLAIEILSPEDTFPKLQQRLDDYLSMGFRTSGLSIPSRAEAGG